MATEESLRLLGHAVRGRVVLKYTATLCLPLLLLIGVPFLVALATGETAFAVRCAVVATLLLAVCLPFARIGAPTNLQVNETLVVVILTFIVGASVLVWPLTALHVPPLDAMFESVSGITTTGLSALGTLDGRPAVLLFSRAWLQWYGGLVILVLALALVMAPGTAIRRLSGEGVAADDIVAGSRSRMRNILAVYIALTAVAVLALVAAGASWFQAFVHALAAVSTGGFSTFDGSIAGFHSAALSTVISIVSFLGAVSFALQWRALHEGPLALARDLEVRTLVIAMALTAVLLWITMATLDGQPWGQAARHAAFLAVSAQTTTGFSTVAVGSLDPASKLVVIVSMFIGGDMGSTAGGIKIFRLLLVLHLIRILLARTRLPYHAVTEPEVGARRLSPGELQAALAVVMLYLLAAGLSWFAFLIAGRDPLNSLFEVVSALGTVGLSAGVTGPALAPFLKVVLCLDMLMGRVEILAFVVLLWPSTWWGRRESTA